MKINKNNPEAAQLGATHNALRISYFRQSADQIIKTKKMLHHFQL